MWGILSLRNILMMYLFLETSKEMIPLGLDFPASLGGEEVFFTQGQLLYATRDKHGRCFKIINRHGCSGCSPTFTNPTRSWTLFTAPSIIYDLKGYSDRIFIALIMWSLLIGFYYSIMVCQDPFLEDGQILKWYPRLLTGCRKCQYRQVPKRMFNRPF